MTKLFGIDKLARDVADARHAEVFMYERYVSDRFKWTPIESLFYTSFYYSVRDVVWRLFLAGGGAEKLSIDVAKTRVEGSLEGDVYVFPQCKTNDHRVDFIICHNMGELGLKWVAVECDGHDFHERTKEQAARDRSIDRQLQADGFVVLRFTGSEIFRDAMKCGREAAAALNVQ